MGKTFLILKISLFLVALVLAVIGLVALGFTIKVTVAVNQVNKMYPNEFGVSGSFLVWPYLVSFGILGLSGLAAFGTFKQRKTPLIVFSVLMGISTVILFTHAINFTVVYYKVKHATGRMYQEPGVMFNTIVGILYGSGLFTLLGTVLSKLMANQIKQHNGVL